MWLVIGNDKDTIMIDRRIKLRHLQSFVEIARQQSLKKAAEMLFFSQPAISKTLKELEAIVGTPLMTRSRAGVELTPQGEIFLRFAEMSVAALHQGLDGIGQIREGSQTRLVIGALPSVAAHLLPEAVLRFNALASGAVLSIISGPHVNGGDKADHLAAQIQAIERAPSGMARAFSR